MLNNYHYFIALAEELNISKAANRLFISHQCLSKYLKNLEQAYGLSFFDRSPRLALTPAGKAYLATLRQVQFLEANLNNQLADIMKSKRGCIRFGTTEGRYRILIPCLLTEFKKLYPEVKLVTYSGTSKQLCDLISTNELDLALMNSRNVSSNLFSTSSLLDETLYMVISDHLLAQYFPNEFPQCKTTFKKGIDLSHCQNIPFILNQPGLNSRNFLDSFLQSHGISINCVLEMTQQDLHFMLAAKDYAACFCWAMYVPTILESNAKQKQNSLNIFPIKGFSEHNQIILVTSKGKKLPIYGQDLVSLLKNTCREFSVVPEI